MKFEIEWEITGHKLGWLGWSKEQVLASNKQIIDATSPVHARDILETIVADQWRRNAKSVFKLATGRRHAYRQIAEGGK